MKKRIFFLTHDFPPLVGGAGNVQYNAVLNFTSEVTVITPYVKGAYGFDARQPFKICRYKPWRISLSIPKANGFVKFMSECVHLVSLFRDIHPTEIHIGYPNANYFRFARYMKRLMGIPYLIYTYAIDVLTMSESMLRNLRAADKVYTISTYTKNLLIDRGICEENILLVMPSIDTVYLHAFQHRYQPKRNMRRELEIEDAFFMLTVSRLVPRKGHDYVLYALAKLKDRVKNLIYVIVGDGPERDRLERLTVQLGIEKQVHFRGIVDRSDLLDLYKECDLFIMPNRKIGIQVEGLGLVFLEANAARKPVIGGNSGGAADAILDGETGLLVNPEDIDEIAEAILLLYKNENLRLAMGEKGRKRVEQMKHWPEIAHKLETAL